MDEANLKISSEKKYILGIDIGTTSVKVCVYDPISKVLVAKQNKDTAANIPSDQGIEGNKQDVPKIVSALHLSISRLPKDLLRHVCKIGICGQMHGVMLWKTATGKAWEKTSTRFDVIKDNVSALYTWQDTRCKPQFLESLPKPSSHLKCYSGYGCATLLWMLKHKPEKLKKFDCSATIQDFVVAMLCDLEKPVMSDQNAASWGYFNTSEKKWNADILKSVDFPLNLLPDVVTSGGVAGVLSDTWYGIPKNTPVGAALGDLQCSFLATLENKDDAVLNISTSAQIGFVVNTIGPSDRNTIEYLPYFDTHYLAVAASLNGGNVLATFVKTIQQWVCDLGFSVPQAKVWEKLISQGTSVAESDTLMTISPVLIGERHNPEAKASISNINLSNIELGHVFKSLCEGVIHNLLLMMPRDFLVSSKIKRIVGNGSGLSRNVVLQKAVEHCYNLPLEFTSGGDAAKGAAIAMA